MQAARGENDRTKLVITSSSETDHDHEHVSLVGNLTSPDSGRSNGRHDDGHGAHENRHGSDERPVPKPSQRRLGFFAVAVVLFASVAGESSLAPEVLPAPSLLISSCNCEPFNYAEALPAPALLISCLHPLCQKRRALWNRSSGRQRWCAAGACR